MRASAVREDWGQDILRQFTRVSISVGLRVRLLSPQKSPPTHRLRTAIKEE